MEFRHDDPKALANRAHLADAPTATLPEEDRRKALQRLGRYAAYAAPARMTLRRILEAVVAWARRRNPCPPRFSKPLPPFSSDTLRKPKGHAMAVNPRLDNARTIRAAHGSTLSAKSWLTSAD